LIYLRAKPLMQSSESSVIAGTKSKGKVKKHHLNDRKAHSTMADGVKIVSVFVV
jgi:hypothetical protein